MNAFTTFLEEKIRKEENANFVRQKPDNDGKGGNNKTRVKMYQTTLKKKRNGNAHGYKRSRQALAQLPHSAPKTNKPMYCIFCENSSHYTNKYHYNKHTGAFKEQRCAKHNACYASFRKKRYCEWNIICFL